MGKFTVSRTPHRFTFVGGGTDLPEFYYDLGKEYGYGACVAAATGGKDEKGHKAYAYVIVNDNQDGQIIAKYVKTNPVNTVDEISNGQIREAMKYLRITTDIQIDSISDLAYSKGGKGLGSSSTFAVGVLNALHGWRGDLTTPEQLAEEAYHIERDMLHSSCGKQDQYIAAFGGLRYMKFMSDGTVRVESIDLSMQNRIRLSDHLLFFYTGTDRDANSILKQQGHDTQKNSAGLARMRDLADDMFARLRRGESVEFIGEYLDQNWRLKRQLVPGRISDNQSDALYERLRSAGASGGKIIGAGGGGYWMVFAPPERHGAIREIFRELGMIEKKFEIDYKGSILLRIGE